MAPNLRADAQVAGDQGIDLTGTRMLVTGGTSGLGLAMASALARAGATVVLTSRSADRAAAVAARLPNAVGVAAHARDEASVAGAVEQAWSRLGRLDMLVNNAGLGMNAVNPRFMTEPLGFWEVPADGFRAVLDTNLTGYFLMAREVTPRMLAVGGGRIVNISVNHATMNRRGFVPYGPSRAGAEALSRIMAADLAGTEITVNILLPGGATETGMLPPAPHRPAQLTVIDPAVMGPPIVWLALPHAAACTTSGSSPPASANGCTVAPPHHQARRDRRGEAASGRTWPRPQRTQNALRVRTDAVRDSAEWRV